MSEFMQDHSANLAILAKQKIAEFNALHWDATLRQSLGLKKLDQQGALIAALTGRTFGNWFYVESFWLAEPYRGQGMGRAMLNQAEQIARERGCRYVLLDTLNFQAKPFYQRLGYKVCWVQADYPLDGGAKYFMQKLL